jgi:molecular chaperone GrpE (heat shock protein)
MVRLRVLLRWGRQHALLLLVCLFVALTALYAFLQLETALAKFPVKPVGLRPSVGPPFYAGTWFWIVLQVLGLAAIGAIAWTLHRCQTALRRDQERLEASLKRAQQDWDAAVRRLNTTLAPGFRDHPRQGGETDSFDQLQTQVAELKQVVEPLRKHRKWINQRINTLMDQVSARPSRQEVDSLSGQVVEASQQLQRLTAQVGQLAGKTIVTYFDEWKVEVLQSAQAQEMERTLSEFTAENRTLLLDNQEAQQKILGKARIWFDSLRNWAADLRATGAGNSSFAAFRERSLDYCRRGQELLANLEGSLARFELKQLQIDFHKDLSFLDVVSGRSADAISAGYHRRLAERLQDLKRNTVVFQQEWDKLRGELLDLLDQFYGLLDAQATATDSLEGLEAKLRTVLGAARIGEIQVELNETVYDPAVHEALAGAALTRPDLPENTIVKLDRRGFFYEGKVLRRALVTLSCRGK